MSSYGGVPFVESGEFADPYWEVPNLRGYSMGVQLFRDCWTSEIRAAPGRAEALVAVLGGVTPDDVHTIELHGIGRFPKMVGTPVADTDISTPMQPYGGVREWEPHD